MSLGLAFRLRRRSRAALRRNARPYGYVGVIALRSSLTLPRFPVLLPGKRLFVHLYFAKITFSWASDGIGLQFVDEGLEDFPFFVGEVTRVPDSRLNRFFSPGKLRDYIA